MSRAPSPVLPIPSRAEARSVGVFVPQMPCEMEQAVGVDACRAFLARYGGRKIGLPTSPATTKERNPRPAFDWLREMFGFGRMETPLGPASNAARPVWAVRGMFG